MRKRKRKEHIGAIVYLPIILGTLSGLLYHIPLAIAAICSVFLAVKISVHSHNVESLWIFLLSFPTCLPMDLRICFSFTLRFFETFPFWMQIILFISVAATFISVELILLVLISRCIWRKQKTPIQFIEDE